MGVCWMNPRITLEVYVKGDADMKRAALGTSMSGLFVIPTGTAGTARYAGLLQRKRASATGALLLDLAILRSKRLVFPSGQ